MKLPAKDVTRLSLHGCALMESHTHTHPHTNADLQRSKVLKVRPCTWKKRSSIITTWLNKQAARKPLTQPLWMREISSYKPCHLPVWLVGIQLHPLSLSTYPSSSMTADMRIVISCLDSYLPTGFIALPLLSHKHTHAHTQSKRKWETRLLERA